MDWIQALEIVVARTGVARYRLLCSEHSPAPDQIHLYRALMVRLATGEPEPPPAGPTAEDLALQAHIARHGCCGG